MLNDIQSYSYIQPHRHLNPPKSEIILVIKGSITYITFSADGKIEEAIKLSNRSNKIGVDTEPDIYHTFFALEQDTVLFEIKTGPYKRTSDKDFANWAPRENSDECKEYLESLHKHTDNLFYKDIKNARQNQ
jgi:cupin fold WbuC family metalloprotein